MKKSLIVVALAVCASVWAVDTARVTAPGGATADYASLQAALDACTGGETVTMLTDETMTSQVRITKDVTLDLAGHTITMSKYADFLTFSSNLTATVCGGGTVDVRTARSCITVQKGSTVTVTNCTLKGYCMFYGPGNSTLNIHAGTVADVDYFQSGYSSSTLNVASGHFKINRGWWQGISANNANKPMPNLTGGYFTRDPFITMSNSSGYGVLGVSETLDGTVYGFQVVPNGEITNRARVTTGGGATTDYASLQTALNACTGGETVTMLASEELTAMLTIPQSVTIDLAGFTVQRKVQYSNAIQLNANLTATIRNGTVVGANIASCFAVQASAVLNVTNCTAIGYCTVWGNAPGKVIILSDTFVDVTYLASGNGSVALDVMDGYFKYTSLWDKSTKGTTIRLYKGRFSQNPAECVAEGSRCIYQELSYNGTALNHQVLTEQEIAALGGIEATVGNVGFLRLQNALNGVQTGGTVCMAKDIVASAKMQSPTNGAFVLDFGGYRLTRSGDVLDVTADSTLRVRNGAIQVASAASGFVMRNRTTLVAESTFRLEGASGKTTCGVYMPFNGARIVFDGAQIATSALYSRNADTDSTLEVTGDSVVTCSSFNYPGTTVRLPPKVVATGGSFAINPTSYVTNNHVVLYRAAATPCKWQVKPWAAICSDGWTFDLPAEAATVTGTCTAPSGPITVSLTGKIPTRKTLLADLSGLTLGSGTYADLSFVKSASLPGAVQVSYEGGKLYAWEAKGTIIVFQ